VDGVGAADRVGPCLGQADVADLALGDQVGQGADGLLDGRVRVDPVLVVQVDVVGAEPLERALDRGADVGRTAVGDAGPAVGVGDQAEAATSTDLTTAPPRSSTAGSAPATSGTSTTTATSRSPDGPRR
jgi:hypothetical protein